MPLRRFESNPLPPFCEQNKSLCCRVVPLAACTSHFVVGARPPSIGPPARQEKACIASAKEIASAEGVSELLSWHCTDSTRPGVFDELQLAATTVVFLYVYPTLLVQLEVGFSVLIQDVSHSYPVTNRSFIFLKGNEYDDWFSVVFDAKKRRAFRAPQRNFDFKEAHLRLLYDGRSSRL